MTAFDWKPLEGRGPSLITRSGARFYLADPRVGDFDMEDMVYSLSRICRYNGHISDDFEDDIYSVAQHSVYVYRWVNIHGPDRARYWAATHDCPEGIYGDTITPIKRAVPEVRDMEERGAAVMREQFNIPYDAEIEAAVHEADQMVLYAEMKAVTDYPERHFNRALPAKARIEVVDPDFHIWSPKKARHELMDLIERLQKEFA